MTEEPAPANEPIPDAEPKPDAQPAADLGDGGKKAIDTERAARKQAEREARDFREKLAAMEAVELRRAVASEKGLTPEQAAFLTGDDEEAMAAKADALLAAFKPDEDGDGVPRRPRERLRTGAVPMAQPTDMGSVADSVIRNR